MYYETQIQGLLTSNSSITSLVKSFANNSVTRYAIFKGTLPKNVSTDTGKLDLTVNDSTINHYRSSGVDGGQMIVLTAQTIVCRAYTQKKAEEIQQAVFDVLSRKEVTNGYFHCIKLPVIESSGDTDNFNASVEARVVTFN